jgi:flagellar hook-associated protein 2
MSSVSSLNSLLSSALGASSTSSSGINLSSLLQTATGATSAGIDVTSAVTAALYADRAPEREWQAQQSTIASQITALSNLQTALSSVSNDLDSLNDIGGPLAARAVSSSASQISGTATPNAAIGSHSISVQSLATGASWYSPSLPSSSSGLGTSTLTITGSDGTQTSFNTGSGVNSLSALASTINASGIGVNASIVTDASGSRLALVSATTGSAADFTVSYGASGANTWSSASLASSSTPLSAGSFQLSDGTSTATVNVNSGDTLSTVAGEINALGLNVSATVVTDSSGAHLQIGATGGGAVSVSADPAFAMTRASTATNASLTVDGIPISSATNTVSGAITGLTLNLTGTTPANNPVTLTVGSDTTQMSQALSTFVSDYNSALSQVNSQFTYSASSGSQGVLGSDSTIRSLQSALESVVSYSSPNSSAGSGTIQSLSDLGITMNDDGSLSLDSSKLASAMANPTAVQNFFQGSALNGFAQQFSSDLDQFNNPATGAITTEVQNLNQQYNDLQSQVNDYESGYIASQQTVLTAMYSKAEIALQQLPAEMQQIQSQLGNNNNSN